MKKQSLGITLLAGDCVEIMSELDENSIDSCVCDPPYHLTSIVKRFGGANAAPAKGNEAFIRASRGFMGKQWDGGDVAFRPETWAEVYRVLKPGGYLLAFSGTRTYHRMACAIEDAGFELRDMVSWVYGSGFPKSHDVSKGIDRAAGAVREVIGSKLDLPGYHLHGHDGGEAFGEGLSSSTYETRLKSSQITAPSTDAAREWQGWGTALKPALEPICMARKPLSEKTVVANVLKWGTGAINVDGCRVPGEFKSGWSKSGSKAGENTCMSGPNYERAPKPDNATGRWPANLIHDGSDEVIAAFPEARSTGDYPSKSSTKNQIYGERKGQQGALYADSGSAARFFYQAKANKRDRVGSKHPTVKPINLMQYLCRMVTPKGGTVLDPFAGTGTTGEAAWREGFKAILIEREKEYQRDITRRMKGLRK